MLIRLLGLLPCWHSWETTANRGGSYTQACRKCPRRRYFVGRFARRFYVGDEEPT